MHLFILLFSRFCVLEMRFKGYYRFEPIKLIFGELSITSYDFVFYY